jgi:broad specificity phosphatase PhoE
MIIYLVRHGETTANRAGIALGRADVPLTELGVEQAAAVGRRLATIPFDRVFSSPLSRAVATARALVGERPLAIETREALIELDVGETEGMTFPEMRQQYGDFLERWAGPDGYRIQMPGGESLTDLEARLQPFIAELRALAATTIAVVSHNFVSRVLIANLLGLDASAVHTIHIDLASISTMVTRENQRLMVRGLNDRCHLHGLVAISPVGERAR